MFLQTGKFGPGHTTLIVEMKAEIGMVQLHAKECPKLPAKHTRRWGEDGTHTPSEPSEEARPESP